ncbi:D-sedoheptulose 7-phosphate isomerase [Paraburkholderia caballeronis]|uniref:D-sedoheptulose-7-phosphate isomerase n=1 Tax=Paraburkholderia caballeronis TaxID=416943 RepID=UPI0010EFA1B1|nr:SIS domain-containing protein [Paraburkholderia caballeronis]TDV34719.1 D-sedoheptulose 7-phosphate isomerase [Paraburkholderia caballeronis]
MINAHSPAQTLQTNINQSLRAKAALLDDAGLMATFAAAATHVIACYRAGGRLYVAGNGGSAADSQHLAAEFVSKLARDRNPLPAEALTTDTSILTAIGNDYGYEHVFSRQLIAKLRPNDVFLGITTSGKSKNVLAALEVCKKAGVKSIVFTGFGGGPAADLADFSLAVPGDRTSTIQELHIMLAHSICESVELALFPMEA